MGGKISKIIQFTDCHVSADPAASYRGIDPRRNLESLLDLLADEEPDLVLLSGDLAEDGSKLAYEYLADKLKIFAAPLLTVPGNHDDSDLQKTVFRQTPTVSPLLIALDQWQIIALNSAVKGQIAGHLGEEMLDGLDRLLQDQQRPKLVVLHHHPVATGSEWIDRYPLQEPESLWARLDGRSDIHAVTWGHIHHEFTAQRGRIRLLGTPSTSANSLPGQKKFSFDPAGAACRVFELGSNGSLVTRVVSA